MKLSLNTCLACMSSVTFGVHSSSEMVPLSSAVVCIESITSLCWGGSLRLLFLVYVWLSCWAVSAVVCIESIPAYAGVIVRGCHF